MYCYLLHLSASITELSKSAQTLTVHNFYSRLPVQILTGALTTSVRVINLSNKMLWHDLSLGKTASLHTMFDSLTTNYPAIQCTTVYSELLRTSLNKQDHSNIRRGLFSVVKSQSTGFHMVFMFPLTHNEFFHSEYITMLTSYTKYKLSNQYSAMSLCKLE
jgi:hypothetical protein